jgi:hypothetical protein
MLPPVRWGVARCRKLTQLVMLRLLSTQLPLETNGLAHLKRVRKLEGVAYYARILLVRAAIALT